MKRTANLAFLVIFLLGLAAVPVCTLLEPKSTSSYWENRSLSSVPELTAEGVLDGSYFDALETYFSDHIVYRDTFLKLHTWIDLRLGRPVVNSLVASSDVMLNFHGYGQWDLSYQQTQADQVGERLDGINRLVTDYGGYFCYLGVQEQYSYFADHYPSYMDDRQWVLTPARQIFSDALAERNIPFVDMAEIYEALGRPTCLYSAVDHHYTYLGALAAYEAVLERINTDTGLNLTILREGDGLELTTLPNHYLGSRTREVYDLWPSDEKAILGIVSPSIPFTRFDNGVQVESTLYALPETEEESVLYSIYMGGDIAETIIRTDRPELPNALIFGESFTNAVETVLWTAFDETRSLDLRYYAAATIEEYIAEYQPDVVICLRDDTSYLTSLD
jgi:hypothetical protein